MSDSDEQRTSERYSQRNNPAFESLLARRSAEKEAAFFLSHIRPGMRVLDIGCGPGSITIGLATHTAPGVVAAIDRQITQVKAAQALAIEHRIANVRVLSADIYHLPFASQTFDAVFALAVLMHLADPVRALSEMRRVLSAGGLAGVRDPDFGSTLMAPINPVLEKALDLRNRVRQFNGSDPFVGRRHRALMLEAGFDNVEATASLEAAGSSEKIEQHGAWLRVQIGGLFRTALDQKWISPAESDDILVEIDRWSQRPDAFYAVTWCEAIARAPC